MTAAAGSLTVSGVAAAKAKDGGEEEQLTQIGIASAFDSPQVRETSGMLSGQSDGMTEAQRVERSLGTDNGTMA